MEIWFARFIFIIILFGICDMAYLRYCHWRNYGKEKRIGKCECWTCPFHKECEYYKK